jgi:hypothetical protein
MHILYNIYLEKLFLITVENTTNPLVFFDYKIVASSWLEKRFASVYEEEFSSLMKRVTYDLTSSLDQNYLKKSKKRTAVGFSLMPFLNLNLVLFVSYAFMIVPFFFSLTVGDNLVHKMQISSLYPTACM